MDSMRNRIEIDLIKDNWYRITDIDGNKCKMQFVNKGNNHDIITYCFEEWTKTLIISEGCIAKIESYKTISPDQQAKNLGKFDEYLKYMRINGKKVRTKYIYTTVFEQNKKEHKTNEKQIKKKLTRLN
jgi:hypothetical protein